MSFPEAQKVCCNITERERGEDELLGPLWQASLKGNRRQGHQVEMEVEIAVMCLSGKVHEDCWESTESRRGIERAFQ